VNIKIDPETVVDQQLLLKAAYDADIAPQKVLENRDFYLTIVATAAGLPFEEVKKKFIEGDKGLIRARMIVKHILFQRTYGMQPKSA
jgi:hypothetical protein